MDAKQVLIGYIVVGLIVLLLTWFVDEKSVGWVFLWLLFVLIVMLFAMSQGHCHALIYLAVVGILPVIGWMIWSWAACNGGKKPKPHH